MRLPCAPELLFVTLVFNDCSYGLIKWKEEDRYGENFYVDFTNPDFVKFAESMHAIGYRINSAEELIPTLEKAFEQKVPVIIDCPVDYRENTKLTEHLKELITHIRRSSLRHDSRRYKESWSFKLRPVSSSIFF